MSEKPPKFPDNPNHANGTCEECGEPCQVYGCRWCPACYGEASQCARKLSSAVAVTQFKQAVWMVIYPRLKKLVDWLNTKLIARYQ